METNAEVSSRGMKHAAPAGKAKKSQSSRRGRRKPGQDTQPVPTPVEIVRGRVVKRPK